MCGIFGIISKKLLKRELFMALGELNKQRGNLAFGGLLAYADKTDVFRYAQPFAPELVPDAPAVAMLGHIRAPTGRQSASLLDVHPFAATCGLLAHNGLLLNDGHFPQWRLNTAVAVDSQIILGGIQAHLDEGAGMTEAICQTVEKLEGQQACWFWAKPEQTLYLWRVMSPIYVGEQPEQFVFSSTQHEWANTLLPEGTIFRFDLQALKLTACGQFSYYSPYQM